MARWGGVDGLLAGVDRGVQVGGLAGLLEPPEHRVSKAGQTPGEGRVARWGGVDGLLAGVDRGVQVRDVPGPLVPVAQRIP